MILIYRDLDDERHSGKVLTFNWKSVLVLYHLSLSRYTQHLGSLGWGCFTHWLFNWLNGERCVRDACLEHSKRSRIL
jgi:hypothetical protein